MASRKKTLLDYVPNKEPLVPMQVRLPQSLVEHVKAQLATSEMTFTDFVKGACYWYLDATEEGDDPLAAKKKAGRYDR